MSNFDEHITNLSAEKGERTDIFLPEEGSSTLKKPKLEKQLTFWKEQLRDISILELPTDHRRPPVQTFLGATHTIHFPESLTEALRGLSRKEDVTLFMTLMAAFQSLLHRYTGQEDIVVGAPAANRNSEECEGLINFFVNTLVIRTDASGDPGFRELLKRIKKTTLDAYAHQDLSFERLAEELQPERDLSRNPLFQVMFSLQDIPVSNPKLSGLTLRRLGTDSTRTRYDLEIHLQETKEGLKGEFVYNTGLFDTDTIRRMAGHYQIILEGIVSNSDRRLSELPLLTEAEQHQLLVEWNNTATDYPRDKCIHELFEEQVEKTPDATAVVFEDQKLTYRELNTRANQLAHYLKRRGVYPGIFVGVCLERSAEAVVALLGTFKSGGVYVPLDSAYPRVRLLFMLKDSRASVLVTQKQYLQTLPEHDAINVCLDAERKVIDSESKDNPVSGIGADHIAYAIYTSGSTGAPKGVLITQRAIAGHCFQIAKHYELCPSDRVYQFASMSFDGSMEQILPTLLAGAAVILRDSNVWTPLAFSENIAHFGLTILCLPPSFLHEWAQSLVEFPNSSSAHQPRMIICGGEELRHGTTQILKRTSMSCVRLLNVYGPTEATITATLFEVDLRSQESLFPQRIPIGRPSPNRTIYIIDRYGNLLPAGIPGEIHIGGDFLAYGYLNRPDLTEEKFIPDPFDKRPGARLYKTGDLGRFLSDGTIEFLGRIDHQVKVRGFRIEPGEIEAVLAKHPAVRETVVLAREDQPGEKRLVAYVVFHFEPAPTTSELRRFLGDKLPDYMIPSVFIPLEVMPLTANGKVDRRALPIPGRTRPLLEKIYVPPRTAVEQELAAIWAEVLGLEQVGIHDNFFELGGDSLLATQVMSRLRNAFYVEISLRRLFETPTIAGLAGAVSTVSTALIAKEQQSAPLIVPVPREGELQLSFAQERLWFLDQLEPGSSAYNIPLVMRLTGDINVTALEESLGEILRRHEVLRTTFVTENDQPVQRIAPPGAFILSHMDLSAAPEDLREAKAQQLASEEGFYPFDIAAGPLLRATLLRLTPQEHVLLLTVHHIVSDGWSIGILCRELSAFYEAFSKGNPSPLPELPIQYGDFAVWQRTWLQGERLKKQLTFWKEQLKDISPLAFPTDHARPPMQTFHGDTHTIQISQSSTEALQSLSLKEGVTLFMTLLAAFQVLLHRYTGQDDIVIGIPIANRNRAATEGLIGFFVNTLVMRTDTSGDPVFRELLKQVQKTTLDAYTHQDLPFEKLVEELQPERDLSRNPLFQVMFALQNIPVAALNLTGLIPSRMKIEEKRTKFDLEVELWKTEEGLKATFVYNTDLFDIATIKRMAGHYQMILDGVVANPDRKLSELPLLTEPERHQILTEWNDTAAVYPEDKCIHKLFEEHVERVPNNIAVVFKDKKITYSDLNERANQLARGLRTEGVRSDVIVGIMVHRSIDMILGLLGILKAGGAYLPIDPQYPDSRIEYMLKDSNARILLTQGNLMNRLAYDGNRIALDKDSFIKEDASNLDMTGSPCDLAYLIYTSGSTGMPKGVMLEHRGVVNLSEWFNRKYDLSKNRNVIQNTIFSFDVAVEEIIVTLTSGACLFLPGNEETIDKDKFLTFIKENRINIAQFVPTTLREFLADTDKIESLNIVICGGEALDELLKEQILQKGYALYNNYGPTEITVDALSTRCSNKKVTIGKPISNKKCYILDKRFNPVPIGIAGELCIGGAGLARGYLNCPELTAEKFIPNSFSDEPGARLYRTGDLARYLPDGNIEFLGRIDHQVKIRGFRIEIGEVEAILGHHPDVKETIVIVREDQPGNKRLVAYVVHNNKKSALATNELRSFMKGHLPDYMVPSAFVALDSLPLTPNGKVDQKALPAPDSERLGSEDSYVSPRIPIEKVLAGIWCEILGLNQVGVHDNFFELGGHSLLATQVMSRLRKVFEVEIPLRTLFESPTVEELAFALLQREGEREKLEQRAALLLKVAELSEDEVNTMLEERIRERHNNTNE
ncbi:MAG: amino acid adenylation domain-containing protein [Nitrospirae bacterium]|nr:amino acid adenylation domain-containing protein [Nitrospirota bacterium]